MKKIYLLLVLSALSYFPNAQTVNIIDNLGTSVNIVLGSSNYHVSESIYLNQEIGAGNFLTDAIQKVGFFIETEGPTTVITNYRIWMKNVSGATTTLATGIYNTGLGSNYVQVFNGTLNATAGLAEVTLTTPFLRTAGSNLQVCLERLDGVANVGNVVFSSVGNIIDVNTLSTRRYNNTTLPASGVTSLTASNFRPAIEFVHTFPTDAGVLSITGPGITCYDTPQSIAVEISNDGTSPIAAGAASVTLKVGGANTFSGTQTNTAIIAAGATEVITFNGINLSNGGTNFDTAYVTLPLDGTTWNDTLSGGNITATTLGDPPSAYPIVEDAETTLPVFSYIEPIIGTQLWGLQVGDYDAEASGLMPVPLSPRAPGTTFYLFNSFSSTEDATGFESRLFSNCIKMPSQALPNPAPVTTLSFWMSRDTLFNADGFFDSLYVSISADHGQTWTRLLPGYQRNKAAGDPAWEQKIIDISAYNGQTIQIGFEGASDWGNSIGLDDITVSFTGVAPVSIVNFEARKAGSVNKLNWSTSQELNSNKFIIERSNDGRTYSEIGTVNAAGNSNTTRNYNFTDLSPVKGINYYRLRIVDNDNSYKFSVVRNVRNLGAADMVISPNPVLHTMKITLDVEKAEKATITVTDLSGKRMSATQVNVIEGMNNIELPVGNLAKGSYIVMVTLADQTVVRKINKL